MSTPICANGHQPTMTRLLQAEERGFTVPTTIDGKRVHVCPNCGLLFIDPQEIDCHAIEETGEW